MVTIPKNAGLTVLHNQFYIKLPQASIIRVNGAGINYNLTPCNLNLSRDDVRTLILNVYLQDRPVALLQANFNLGEANINTNSLEDKIHAKIHKPGLKQICHLVFSQLCPGYSNQPHAALDHIRHQSFTGPNNQFIMLMVIEFYQCLINKNQPFQAKRNYPACVRDIFIWKLDCWL